MWLQIQPPQRPVERSEGASLERLLRGDLKGFHGHYSFELDLSLCIWPPRSSVQRISVPYIRQGTKNTHNVVYGRPPEWARGAGCSMHAGLFKTLTHFAAFANLEWLEGRDVKNPCVRYWRCFVFVCMVCNLSIYIQEELLPHATAGNTLPIKGGFVGMGGEGILYKTLPSLCSNQLE